MQQHGRYTVLRKLADGGMAEIFLARQHGSQGFQKPVVLKRIHAAFIADEGFRNMLIDEAHISMGLSHANIVQVLDLGQSDGRYFLVLELVDGWDLGRLLKRAASVHMELPAALGVYTVAQVCRALDYAHNEQGPDGRPLRIVHRDVSPQNVLVSDEGEVKLADFGIAKAQRKREQTDSGVVKGKVAFMSPEQAMGQELDARSDIYSLGTLLYLLLVGRRPFEGGTDLEVLMRVQKGQFTLPQAVLPSIDPMVATIIMRAMSFDRDDRYPSAHHMLVDLENALRARFGSSGQTELKMWLGELARLNKEPTIGNSQAVRQRTRSGSGSGSGLSGADLQIGQNLDLGGFEDSSDLSLAPNDDEPFGEDAPEDLVGASSYGHERVTAPTRPGYRDPHAPRITGAEATSLEDLRASAAILATDYTPEIIRSQTHRRRRGVGIGMVLVLALAAGGVGFGSWRYWSASRAAKSAPPAPAIAAKPAATEQRPQVRALPAGRPLIATPPPTAATPANAVAEGSPAAPAPTAPPVATPPPAAADRQPAAAANNKPTSSAGAAETSRGRAGRRAPPATSGLKYRRGDEIPGLIQDAPPPPPPAQPSKDVEDPFGGAPAKPDPTSTGAAPAASPQAQ